MILLLSLALNSKCQEPPKGTNLIIVKNSDIKLVVLTLEEKGFSVANDGYGVLTTIPRRQPNRGVIMITAKIKDSLTYLSGVFEDQVITPELFKNKESYGGHQLSRSFDVLNEIAKSLHGEISYFKK